MLSSVQIEAIFALLVNFATIGGLVWALYILLTVYEYRKLGISRIAQRVLLAIIVAAISLALPTFMFALQPGCQLEKDSVFEK